MQLLKNLPLCYRIRCTPISIVVVEKDCDIVVLSKLAALFDALVVASSRLALSYEQGGRTPRYIVNISYRLQVVLERQTNAGSTYSISSDLVFF